MKEEAPQRVYELREIFNALRWIVRTGAQWRMMPNDLPPWQTVYQQTQRWIKAQVFEVMVDELRMILRKASGRHEQATAAIFDSRTLQSSPESGARAGYDGAKKKNGSKVHIVDTLGNLLALIVTPANEQDRQQVEELCSQVQIITGRSVKVAFVDQGYTGEQAKTYAKSEDVELVVVKLSEAKRGFVLLPKRWVVERSQAWVGRFRRLARNYERLPDSVAALHFIAFACILLHRLIAI